MADLNSMIAQGAQFQAPVDPFVQYGKMQQLQQGQQTNELNKMKMQELQSVATVRNALRQLDPSSVDYENQLFKLDPKLGIDYRKEATAAATGRAAAEEQQVKAAVARQGIISQAFRDISSRPSDANITAHMEDVLASPLFKPNEKLKVQNLTTTLLSMPFNERGAFLSSRGATAGDLSTAATAAAGRATTERGQDLTAGTAARGQDVTQRGQDITAATAKAGQDVTLRGQDLVNAREKENLTIRQEDQRRAADPMFQQTMADAKAAGVNMAKDRVLRAVQLPKVIDTANMTLSEIDALIGKRDAKGNLLKGQTPHPGFEDAVGATYKPGLRFVPGTDAADFQSRFDQVKGGAFLQAFETLKGGGSITNIEGEKGTSALNRMQLAQSEKEFITAAREFQGIVKTGVERAKKLAAEGATSSPGRPVPAAAAPNIDALLNKYK